MRLAGCISIAALLAAAAGCVEKRAASPVSTGIPAPPVIVPEPRGFTPWAPLVPVRPEHEWVPHEPDQWAAVRTRAGSFAIHDADDTWPSPPCRQTPRSRCSLLSFAEPGSTSWRPLAQAPRFGRAIFQGDDRALLLLDGVLWTFTAAAGRTRVANVGAAWCVADVGQELVVADEGEQGEVVVRRVRQEGAIVRIPLPRMFLPRWRGESTPPLPGTLVAEHPQLGSWLGSDGRPDGSLLIAYRPNQRPSGSMGRDVVLSRWDLQGRSLGAWTLPGTGTLSRFVWPPDEHNLPALREGSCISSALRVAAGSSPGPTSPPPDVAFRGPPLQRIEAAEYDAEAGEGVVVIHETGRNTAITFDAVGASHATWALPGHVELHGSLVRSTNGWVALAAVGGERGLLYLTGPLAGGWITGLDPGARSAAWLASAGGSVFVARLPFSTPTPDAPVPDVEIATLDASVGRLGPYRAAALDGPRRVRDLHGALPDRAAPTWIARLDDGAIALVGLTVEGTLRQDGPPLVPPSSTHARVMLLRPWGASVLRHERGPEDVLTWVHERASISTSDVEMRWWHQKREEREPSPLIGDRIIPTRPGKTFRPPDFESIDAEGCTRFFATGPQQIVFVCTRPAVADAPSRIVGTRVFRW